MLENEFDKMLEDLDEADNEFNSYFDEEDETKNKIEKEVKKIKDDFDDLSDDEEFDLKPKVKLSDIDFNEKKKSKTNQKIEKELFDKEIEDDFLPIDDLEKEIDELKLSEDNDLEDYKIEEELVLSEEFKLDNSELEEKESDLDSLKQDIDDDLKDFKLNNEDIELKDFELPKVDLENIEVKKEKSKEFDLDKTADFVAKKSEIEEKIKRKFSYNDILDRLDKEKPYDLNNVDDILKLIDKCETSDDFYEEIEKIYDK